MKERKKETKSTRERVREEMLKRNRYKGGQRKRNGDK